jgi:uncharacterized protein (TIGR02231 family)
VLNRYLLCTLVLTAPAVLAAPHPAPITEVILYSGSATIVRTVPVAAGTNKLELPGLSRSFDKDSLRLDASPGILIGEIVIQDQSSIDSDNPAEQALEAKLQALEDQSAALAAEAKSAELVKAYLERLGGGTDRQTSVQDAKNLAGVIDTIGKGANDALAKIHRISLQQRELGKKIEAVKFDLSRLGREAKARRNLAISLHAPQAGTIRVSYQISNAGWRPAYRADLNSQTGQMELTRLATISQKTKEDWRNVRLRLSTGEPRTTPVGPEPEPWLLSWTKEKPLAPAAPAAPAPAAPALQKVMVTGSSVPSYTAPTFETSSTFATEFEVPGAVSLPADGREISVTLARQNLPGKVFLRISPRQERAAYVVAEAARPEGVWPEGNLQLFRDNSYTGATRWQPADGERMSLPFGRDNLVRVKLDAVKGNSASTGIFASKRERKINDVISVSSEHSTPIEIQVLEASPVSITEEVRVKSVFAPKPETEAWQQQRGVVMWRKTLAAKETAKFNVDYTIEYPKDGPVSGL